ncbi:conserved Plasmodium protein, unknown function [Plasmodium sp. gorilla clade G2]|uniref:conserved Plasmodium protein, unknown function n=1 Tax=Plasmodium sp. gorilla clade G2 TaxID=880535 RepID=UPI000D2100FE|nr:conserved Plasmodium protein, unknown function [Plasmodium sp. gorilla clade G2]SOV14474.1 conserved Plasmodium protein, unknown function [Plasmodium sp. gorilla clade G2]
MIFFYPSLNFYLFLFISIIKFTLLYTKEVNKKWRGAILGTYKPSSSLYNKRNRYKKLYILCKYNILKNVKSKKKKLYVEKIKNFDSLIGGEVVIKHGTFKDCHGVILDIKKTQKDEYEFLVVINQNELIKYPKNILKKFGKSYWFNIKELQIHKIKNSFFNDYNNFYNQKEQPQNQQENNLNNIKEQLNNIHENLLLQYGHEINADDLFIDTLDDFNSKVDTKQNVSQSINGDINGDIQKSDDKNIFEDINGDIQMSDDKNIFEDINGDIQMSDDKNIFEDINGDIQMSDDKNIFEDINGDIQKSDDKNIFENINVNNSSKYEIQNSEKKSSEENFVNEDMSDIQSLKNCYMKGDRKYLRSNFCHSIIKKIEKNYIYEDLLNLYKEKRHVSNMVVCFYILKQLVKIYNFEKDDKYFHDLFLKKVIHNNIFETILLDIKYFLEKKEIYRVVDKTWLLWILIKLNIHKEEKYKEIFQHILGHLIEYIHFDILKKLNTKSLCAILWSLAKCSYFNFKIYKKILYFLQKYISILTCHDISNIYYSLSLVNYKDNFFFDLLDKEIQKKINKFPIQSLMNIIWAMTKSKRNNASFKLVKDKLLFFSTNLDIRNISLFLWCLNKNHYYKVNINFKGKNFQHLNIKQAMQLLIFFNYNKNKYVEYLKYVLNFLLQNIHVLNNQEICFLTYSLAKLNLLKKTFPKIKEHILQRNIKYFNIIDINMLILSLNNSNIYDKSLLTYLLQSLRNILNQNIHRTINNNNNNNYYYHNDNVLLKKTFKEKENCINFNFIMKNLSEMKLYDQTILLKYVFFYSNNIKNISLDDLVDYLFYTTSVYYPPKPNISNVSKEKYKYDNKKVINNNIYNDNMFNDNVLNEKVYSRLIINKDDIILREKNMRNIYHHYLNKIVLFLKEKLKQFEAQSFLEYLNYQNLEPQQNELTEKISKKNDTFTFNYRIEKEEEEVKKLNELILDKQNVEPQNHLQNIISNEEFYSFVNANEEQNETNDKIQTNDINQKCHNNYKHNDINEKCDNVVKKTVYFKSLNSLIHLFYSFSFMNVFDKKKIDFYFDNLYTVINTKKKEMTAYQWLLIKDLINLSNIKNKSQWHMLLDKVHTYVSNDDELENQKFETINIDI